MKNSKPRRLLAAIPLLLVAAWSCGKKTPDPPVSCYRKDGGACQFSKLDASGSDLRGSLDGQKSESGLGPDGSGVPTDSQLVAVRDAMPGDARPPNSDTLAKTHDAASVDGLSGTAGGGGSGGSTGTGGMGGSTGTGSPDASADDAPLIADGPAAPRDVQADARPVDAARDLREAGGDTSMDLVALTDATVDDAPAALVDAVLHLDATLDAPVDAPAQDADESSDGDLEGPPGSCPVVSQAQQYDLPSLEALAMDGVGTPYIAMRLTGSADLGAGTVTSAGRADVLIAKLDPTTLTAAWSKKFSGTGEGSSPTEQIPVGVAVSQSGQIGVIGTFEGNMVVNSSTTLNGGGAPIDFIMATDNSGNGLWGLPVDTQSGGLKSIASHPTRDELVVCGFAIGPVTALGLDGSYGDSPDAPFEDILIAKLNSTTGAVIWARQIGGVGAQVCKAVAMDSTGVVYATGTYNGTLDFGNGALPVMGSSTLAIWVAKLDGADGHALMAKKYGTMGKPAPRGLSVDGNGNVAVTGNHRHDLTFGGTTLTSKGGTDGFLAKLDANLDPLWAMNWGDATDQDSNRVAFTASGQIFAAGYHKNVDNTLDTSWVEYSASGESLCTAIYGDEWDQSLNALAIHGDRVVAGGLAKGTINFAPGISLTSTSSKAFLFVLP